MAKLVLKPWAGRNVAAEVITESELNEKEIEEVSHGIKYASISCCVPGWKERTTQQIREVIEDFYGKSLANCILDVKYI